MPVDDRPWAAMHSGSRAVRLAVHPRRWDTATLACTGPRSWTVELRTDPLYSIFQVGLSEGDGAIRAEIVADHVKDGSVRVFVWRYSLDGAALATPK